MTEPTPRFLIIDDDPSLVQVLGRMLAPLGEVRFALDGQGGLQQLASWPADLVLLDAELPDMSGVALCRSLAADAQLSQIPVIFVTSHEDLGTELDALAAGAVDFIRKPPRQPVVQARVRTQLRLKQLTDALRRQATQDGLTGVHNRLRFDEVLALEWSRARRSALPLSLLMVDVDHFKRYNDHYGHPAGDACLKQLAQALVAAAHRPADLVARYGGEEFVALLPETDHAGALQVAASLCQAVAALALPHADSPTAAVVTVSVGVASSGAGSAAQSAPASAAELLAAADQALYLAKRAGRARAASAPGQGQASEA